MRTKAPRKHAGANWQDVRTRLATAINATKESFELTAEQSTVLLRTRAQALGAAGVVVEEVGEAVEVVYFNLGSEPYAIESRYVREVRKLGSLCRVPSVPDFVVGLTALRGEMLAIMDLRLLLGVPGGALSGGTRLIVMGHGVPEFAIVADGVEQTLMLRLGQLLEPAESVRATHRMWVRGITPDGRTLLNGEALLADDRLIVNLDAKLSEA